MSADVRLRAEDLDIGHTVDLGQYAVRRRELIDFATQWDPMPFHIDEVAARAGTFADVIGSGLHTMAIYQRLAVATVYHRWAIVAGRAIREVNLTSPLRPDTTVRADVTVDQVRPHSAIRALVSMTGRVLEADRLIMTMQTDAYLLRRGPDSGAAG